MSLIPTFGIFMAVEEDNRCRKGILQIGTHDNKPEALGSELLARAYFYYTLAALWPITALVLLLRTLF